MSFGLGCGQKLVADAIKPLADKGITSAPRPAMAARVPGSWMLSIAAPTS